MKSIKNLLKLVGITGLFWSQSLLSASSVDPLIRFTFNEGSLSNSGSLGGSLEIVSGTEFTPSVSQLQDGTWVWDKTGATGMGETTPGENGYGLLRLTGDLAGSLGSLQSFTITGWYQTKTGVQLNNNAQLINAEGAGLIRSNPNGERLTASVYWDPPGPFAHTLTGANGVNELPTEDEWIFVAIVYDGTLSENNLRIIHSLGESFVSQIHTTNHTGATTDPGPQRFILGDRTSNDGTFKGYFKDIRMYGSALDGSGALSNEQIQLTVIPEPSFYGFFGGLFFLLVMLKIRRIHNTF